MLKFYILKGKFKKVNSFSYIKKHEMLDTKNLDNNPVINLDSLNFYSSF